MWFRQLFDSESSTYTYVLADETAGEAVVIDPVLERTADVAAALAEAGAKAVWSLETHVHADHVTAGAALREKLGAKVVLPALASDCGCADITLGDGDVVTFGRHSLRAMHTPGHTPESLSYLVNRTHLFSGDTLLIRLCGRTDFQGGDAGMLYDSVMHKLFVLPDEVLLYPGHDYQGRLHSTIGEERRQNERLVGRTRDEFVTLMSSLNLVPPRRLAEAVPANRACGAVQQA